MSLLHDGAHRCIVDNRPVVNLDLTTGFFVHVSTNQDEDRYHSSCTCKAWNQVNRTPCLWRKRSFIFRGYCRSYADRIRTTRKCIQSVGCHIREIRVSCPLPNLLTARNVTKCVYNLFNELYALQRMKSKVELQSFIFNDLDFDETWNGFRSSRELLVSSLSDFLADQKRLKSIDMSNAFMTSPFAFRVTDAFARSHSARIIERVHLENFFSPTVSSTRLVPKIRCLFRSFARLKRISLNFCYLSNRSLISLCSRLGHTLQQLDLHVSSMNNGAMTPDINGITSQVWKEALCLCPDLKVTLSFEYWPSELGEYAKSEMPVTEVNIRSYLCGSCRSSYKSSINHIFGILSENFQATLNKVSLLLRFYQKPHLPPLRSDDLLSFWSRCPKLRTTNISTEVITPPCSELIGDTPTSKSFEVKRSQRLGTARAIKVKRMAGREGLEYYSFYLPVNDSR